MAEPQLPEPVKLLVAVLWDDPAALAAALPPLSATWGKIDFTGQDHLFELSNYYEPEMGPTLHRRLLTFQTLVAPESVRHAKLRCNEIESSLASVGKRTVNLDVGYLDHNKLVLASAKNAGQKIHLGDGIYADLVARWKHGRYQPFEWTFLDFKDGRYDAELTAIRQRYLAQLREK